MSEKLGDAIFSLKVDSKNFDQGISSANKKVVALEKELKKLSTGLSASLGKNVGAIKRVEAELAKARKEANKTRLSFKKMGQSLKAFATRLLITTASVLAFGFAVKKAFEFAEAGAKINAQAAAFENLAKRYNADSRVILKSLRDVSNGTVDTVNLIESANKALLLGIDPSKFVKLMEIARAASKATGDTITKSFEDITIGIGRQSRMILDNLGIIVKIDDANKQYAKSLGINASALSDTQKKQAFLNATLAAGQKIIDGVGNTSVDAADRVAQIKTSFVELTNELKTTTLFVLDKLLVALDKINKKAEEIKKKENIIGISPGVRRGGLLPGDVEGTPANRLKRAKQFAQFVQNEPAGVKTPFGAFDTSRNTKGFPSTTPDGKNIGIDFKALADDSEGAFKRMENAVEGWASSFSSSMTDVLFGAEVTFGGIINSFAKMIAQMIIQIQVVEPLLQGVFSFLNPGNAPISAPGGGPPSPSKGLFGLGVLGFATGGVVPGSLGSPQAAIVHGGEEVLTPGQRGGGGGVEINIFGAPEGSKVEESQSDDGGRRFDVLLDEENAKNIRPGTETFKTMQKQFGVSRSLVRRG